MRDPRMALDTMAREELGLNPNDLGSPLIAAASSFVMFAIGARAAISLSQRERSADRGGAARCSGLLAVGAAVARLTGRGTWKSALRMLAIGGSAAVITYLVGNVIGVSV
jgi:VIT1/CCC1 family predicted Fe2+/Mn2+ transporter